MSPRGRWLLERIVVAQLRRDIRRIEWLGDLPRVPADRPLVLVANHQAFYDGLVLGLFVRRVLGRRTCVWMEEYDRLPVLGRLGALPFPPDDPERRVRVIRRTAQLLRRDPAVAFIYFPEGRLHSDDEDVLDFPADALTRLARIFPPCSWWPVAVRVSSWSSVRPVATLAGGPLTHDPPADPRAELRLLRRRLADPSAERHTLMEGRRGPDERWAWLGRLLGAGTQERS